MVIEGATLAQVADYLNREMVPRNYRKGTTKWNKARVSALFRSRQVTPLLVNVNTFESALAVLGERYSPKRQQGKRRLNGVPRSDRVWPLQGLLKCAICGLSLIGVSGGRGGLPYLRCVGVGKKSCSEKDLPAEEWENAVISAVCLALKDDAALDGILADIAAKQRAKQGPLAAKKEALVRERDGISLKLDRLSHRISECADAKVAKGMLPEVGRLQGQIDELDSVIDEMTASIDTVSLGGLEPTALKGASAWASNVYRGQGTPSSSGRAQGAATGSEDSIGTWNHRPDVTLAHRRNTPPESWRGRFDS